MLLGNGPESDSSVFEVQQVNPTTMLTMIDFLASKPTFDGIARQLVVSIMGNHRPRAALISVFEHDGSLHSAGSFGLSETAVLASRKMVQWENLEVASSMRICSRSSELTKQHWRTSRVRTVVRFSADPRRIAVANR